MAHDHDQWMEDAKQAFSEQKPDGDAGNDVVIEAEIVEERPAKPTPRAERREPVQVVKVKEARPTHRSGFRQRFDREKVREAVRNPVERIENAVLDGAVRLANDALDKHQGKLSEKLPSMDRKSAFGRFRKRKR